MPILHLIKALWAMIATAAVVVPRVWPWIKMLMGQALDWWARRRAAQLKDEDLKRLADEAEKSGDTTQLESSIGSTSAVGDSQRVVSESAVVAAGVDPSIAAALSEEEEKKSPILSVSEHTGLGTFFKVAGVLAGLAVLDAAFGNHEAKAASMGFSDIILDNVGTTKNHVRFSGNLKMRSKLLSIAALMFLFHNTLGCASALDRNAPDFHPQIFVGNSVEQAFVRRQSNDSLRCESARINGFFAISHHDLLCMQKMLDSCERFSTRDLDCSSF